MSRKNTTATATFILFVLVAKWEERGGDLLAPQLFVRHLVPTRSHTCYSCVDCKGVNLGHLQHCKFLRLKNLTFGHILLAVAD